MKFDVEFSKDGYKILKIIMNDGKYKYLGSKYNQKNQIDNFIQKFEEISEKDNFIIFGLGLADHIKELLNRTNHINKILIIELNENIIEYCRNDIEIRKVLDTERIIIFNNKTDINKFFVNYINEGNINFLKIGVYCNVLKNF